MKDKKINNFDNDFVNFFKENMYSIYNKMKKESILLIFNVLILSCTFTIGLITAILYSLKNFFDISSYILSILKIISISLIPSYAFLQGLGISIASIIKTTKDIKNNNYIKEFDEKILQISESKEITNENKKDNYHEEIITKARELDELINKLSTENKKKYKSLIIEELNKYMESLNSSKKNEINLTLNTPDYTRIHCSIFLEGMKTEVLKLLDEEQHKKEINSLIEDINTPVIFDIPNNKEKIKVKTK